MFSGRAPTVARPRRSAPCWARTAARHIHRRRGPAPRSRALPAGLARASRSNILRGDYAGSDSCARCHAEIHAAWRGSPMHLMTRVPGGADVIVHAPFDGTTFRFKDDTARLVRTRRRAARRSDVGAVRRSPVSRDARHRRALPRGLRRAWRWASPTRASCCCRCRTCSRRGSFRLKGYSVLVGERPGCGPAASGARPASSATTPCRTSTRCGASWRGAGAPTYQGAVVDRLLPRERRWRYEVEGGRGAASTRSPPRSPRSGARRRGRRRLPRRARCTASASCGRTSAPALRRGRHRLRGVPRRQPRARRRPARASRLRAAQPVPAGAARRRAATSRGRSRSTASARAATRCCSRAIRSRGRGEAAPGRRSAGGSSITSGEARDFLLGRLRAPDVVRDLPRSARRGSAARISIGSRPAAGNAVCVRCHRAVRAGRPRWPRTPTTIRPGRGRAASPATCRRRTWGSATR